MAVVSRRALLRGAGGAVLGLPLLEATAGRAAAQPMVSPKRLLIVSAGHSMEVTRGAESWLPRGEWAQLSPLLAPLVPHRDRLLLLSGIDNLLSTSGLIPSNGHNYTSRSLLTCMPTREALDGAGNLLPARPECKPGSVAGGPSVEYVLANAWKEEVLNLRVGEHPGEHTRSFRMDGTLDLGNANPLDAASRLFGSGAPAGPATPQERLRARRRSVLDAVKGNFDSTLARLGRDDRARLSRHAEHVRQFELGLDRMAAVVCANPRLTPPRPLPAANLFENGEARHDDVIAAAQFELVVTAFACQATRVAHVHFSNIQGNTFAFLDGGTDFITGGWHGVVHIDRGTDEQRLRSMRWYMEAFAGLLTRLGETPEGNGTLLDNTLVLFISSLRIGHGASDLPVLLAGNLGGRLKTGQHIRYTGRTTGDLFTTILDTLDVPVTTFGWNKGTAPGGRAFNNGPLAGWT